MHANSRPRPDSPSSLAQPVSGAAAALGSCLLALVSCTAPLELTEREYASIVSIGLDGEQAPTKVDGEARDDGLAAHAAHVAAGARAFFARTGCLDPMHCERRDACAAAGSADRLLIYIHGGLVDRETGCDDAKAILARMGADCSHFYPVFVNWDTALLQAYWNDLFSVVNGRKQRWRAILTSPFFFLADVGRALFQLPVTYFAQGWENAQGLVLPLEIESVPKGWEANAELTRFAGDASPGLLQPDLVLSVVPGVLRLVTTPGLDTIGLRAYTNMRRRASLLFALDEDFEGADRAPRGALSLLMRELRAIEAERDLDEARDLLGHAHRLRERARHIEREHESGGAAHRVGQCECASEVHVLRELAAELLAAFHALPRERKPVHVTLVAHSLGAIPAGELVRRNLDVHFEDIVYLAPACTIREFTETSLAALKSNPATRFWDLTLHPACERGERYGLYTLPFGSLLVWIDAYLTLQESALDWTLGRWNNVMRALPVMDELDPEVRSRIFVRGFGEADGAPRSHSDFDDQPFWRPEFWLGETDVE